MRLRAGNAGAEMSRSGYSDDIDDNWRLICWRGAVASAMRGKRGQTFLKELAAALDALPEKKLITHELEAGDQVCALGAIGRARGIVSMGEFDPEDHETIAALFRIPHALACEIMFMNDDGNLSKRNTGGSLRQNAEMDRRQNSRNAGPEMSDLWYPPEMRGLISAARECADALESEVSITMRSQRIIPAKNGRYERDMAPVTKLREEIEILRLKKATGFMIHFQGIAIDRLKRTIARDGNAIHLSGFALSACLRASPGWPDVKGDTVRLAL